MKNEILTKVFAAAGNANQLAKHLGISRQSVFLWKQVPIKHMKAIKQLTGLSFRQLRPDLYDEDDA
jgi:DNA-binding transcriptional regulator YdaS (Cro superfamily)